MNQTSGFEFDVELLPGERLTLPANMLDKIGPGRWVVTVRPRTGSETRRHSAFLAGYSAEDEGLYDDLAR